jgi:predicted DNA-binding transcriptional regulator YafY
VRIEYVAASGATARRVIDDPDLDGRMLHAWCELRQDERVFSVARIVSVTPVG